MPRLPELQTAFAAGIFDKHPGVIAAIAPGRFAPAQHLQIYRNNVFESLTGALKAIYPVIERLVGEGFFRFAADNYIRQHPPRGGNLHDFGFHYADFLAAFAPAASLPYLPDVARLEWAWHEAFHAADAVPFDARRLAEVPVEQQGNLRFTLNPSARLLDSVYPVLNIWKANQDHAAEEIVELAQGGAPLLVIRRGFGVEIEILMPGEYALLRTLMQDANLETACDAAFAVEGTFDLGGALQRGIQGGVLVALR